LFIRFCFEEDKIELLLCVCRAVPYIFQRILVIP